jgi:hypothetical protein
MQSLYQSLGGFSPSSSNYIGKVQQFKGSNAIILTNDYYKNEAEGLTENTFLLLKPLEVRFKDLNVHDETLEIVGKMGSKEVGNSEKKSNNIPEHLFLVRLGDEASFPTEEQVKHTRHEVNKSFIEVDRYLYDDFLQWCAYNSSIIGTYKLDKVGDIQFYLGTGTKFSPHLYEVYKPSPVQLEKLLNISIKEKMFPFNIGTVRYSVTDIYEAPPINVMCSAEDFKGKRVALFGMTGHGKTTVISNIAYALLTMYKNVGQLVFDIDGELSNARNSLYNKAPDRCVRFSIVEKADFQTLKLNFYSDLVEGFNFIKSSLKEKYGSVKGYLNGFIDGFEVIKDEDFALLDYKQKQRYLRKLSIYKCILYKAQFKTNRRIEVDFNINKEMLEACFDDQYFAFLQTNIKGNNSFKKLDIEIASQAFTQLWEIYCGKNKNKEKDLIREDYFDETEKALLAILTSQKYKGGIINGLSDIFEFNRYHSPVSNKAIKHVIDYLDKGMTVIIDLSNSPQKLIDFFSEKLAISIFEHRNKKYTANELGENYYQLYFEEAHTLFPNNDNDLTNIYNKIVKQGRKMKIGTVYATQSITSLSEDLKENTENFFIAYLNSSHQINSLTKYNSFVDIGNSISVLKSSVGYMWMVTHSHKFAIPVQIKEFK